MLSTATRCASSSSRTGSSSLGTHQTSAARAVLQRQQRGRAVAREALERDAGAARRRARLERDLADPRGLPVVVAQRAARLGSRRQRALRVGEHAALGDDRQVEALGDAGVDLDPAVDVLQRRDRRVEAAVQALRGSRALRPRARPPAAARRCRRRSAPRRAAAPPRRSRGCAAPARRTSCRAAPSSTAAACDTWTSRIGCAQLGAPGAEPLEQLHAAERQRERARVAGDVLVGRARVEQRDLRARQRARRVEREREADRTGADHREIQRRRAHRETRDQGRSAQEVPAYYSPHPDPGSTGVCCHGADGFRQETVHRHHRVDRGPRRRARLALSDGGPRDPERRLADGARIAGRGVRQRGQDRRRLRPRPLHADDRDLAGADLPAQLGQAVQEPVQERRLLLQHAPADRPALGHDPAGDDPRQGLRRGAPARVRQLQLPHRRREARSTTRSPAPARPTPSPSSTASCAA